MAATVGNRGLGDRLQLHASCGDRPGAPLHALSSFIALAPPLRIPPHRYVLKNTARDWSEEGAAEREQSYGRIVRELGRLFASRPAGAEPPSVLVPGCGLARLCLEIVNQVRATAAQQHLPVGVAGQQAAAGMQMEAMRPQAPRCTLLVGRPQTPAPRPRPPAQGFRCQGNEFSYFMLLASAYLLNGVDRELQARGGCPMLRWLCGLDAD